MKRIIALFLALFAVSAEAATPQRAPLQVTNTTEQLPSTSKFFTANSNAISAVVANTLTSQNILTVSPDNGDDASALIGNPLKPFKTIKAALSNAPNGSIVRVLPSTITNLVPLYNYVYETSASDLSGLPGLLHNKTNVTVLGDGVTIKGDGLGAYFGLCNTKDCSIQGFTFDLTKGNPNLVNKLFIGPITHYGTNANMDFARIRMSNAIDQGITGNRLSYGLTVRDSYFYNIGSSNIAYVTNLVGYPYVDGTAISGVGSDTLITNCRFVNNYRDVEWDAIAGATVHTGFSVIGCTFSNTLHGAVVMYDANTNLTTLRNVIFKGNVFHGNQNEYAINSRDSVNQLKGLLTMNCGGSVVISGNTFANFFDYAICLIPASPMEDIVISDNVIIGGTLGWTNVYNKGIVVQASAINATNSTPIKNVTITGNTISHLGSSAMHIMGANVLVNGNNAYDCGKAAGGSYVFWTGGVAGTSNVVYRNNFYQDQKTAFLNHMFAVSDPSKQVFIDRSNVGRNIDTSLVNWPTTVASAVKAEVFLDGKTFTETLVGGTVTINHPLIHATSRIQVSRNVTGGTVGHLSVTRVNETSFTVNSSSGTDTSTLAITVFEDTF